MDNWIDLDPLTIYQITWQDKDKSVHYSPTMHNVENAQVAAEQFRKDGCEARVIEITQTRKIFDHEQP